MASQTVSLSWDAAVREAARQALEEEMAAEAAGMRGLPVNVCVELEVLEWEPDAPGADDAPPPGPPDGWSVDDGWRVEDEDGVPVEDGGLYVEDGDDVIDGVPVDAGAGPHLAEAPEDAALDPAEAAFEAELMAADAPYVPDAPGVIDVNSPGAAVEDLDPAHFTV